MKNEADCSLESAIETVLSSLNNIFLNEEIYHAYRENAPDFPFIVSNKGVCKLCDKKSRSFTSFWLEPVSSYIKVKSKNICMETGEVKVCVELDNGSNIVCLNFDRSIFTTSGIKKLLEFGVAFFEPKPNSFLEYLMKSDRQAKIEHVHSALGWSKIDGVPVFKSYEILAPSKDALGVTNKYSGTLNIEPKGSIEKWLNMVKEDVIPYIPLTLCMVLGFASPLLALLTDKYDLGTFVFNIGGESSTGKSTSAMLFVSTFSNPILSKGTMRSFFDTTNFLTAFLAQGGTFPVAFDEAAVFSKGDFNFNQLMYLIAGGRDKGRLNSDATMKPERSWKTIVLTTAEFEMTDDFSPNGIRARCFSITDTLTTSAAHSDRIKKVVTENFGISGNRFIQWVLDNKYLDLETDYNECKNILYNSLESSEAYDRPLAKRVLAKFAVILQTAVYVSSCFSLQIDLEKFKDYLISLEKNISAKTDLVTTALDCILQEVSRNSGKYLTSDNIYCHNVVGKLTEDNTTKTIYIMKTEFSNICKKYGLQKAQILKKFKEQSLLDCEPDRDEKRVRLKDNMPEEPCYILKINDPRSHRNYDTSARICNNIALQDDVSERITTVTEDELNF
jgi:hypothetical protein